VNRGYFQLIIFCGAIVENMEYEQTTLGDHDVTELPKWVRIIFRIYAVIFLFSTILIGGLFIYSSLTNGKYLLSSFTASYISIIGIVLIVLFAFILVLLVLEILYGIGVYKFKRWSLPLAIIFSFSALLMGFFNLLNLNFDGVGGLVTVLAGMIFMGLVGFLAIMYWNSFSGRARKLTVQIPLMLALFPFILFATLSQIFPDDKEINDSDLILTPVDQLAESDNAHYSLPDLEKLTVEEIQSFESALAFAEELDDKDLSSPEAINLVNQTKNLTDDLIEASKKSGYQCPTTVNNFGLDAVFCDLNGIRDLAHLAAFRAGAEAYNGDVDQSIDTALSLVRLGSLMTNTDQPFLLENLVGISLINTGLKSLENTLDATASSSNETMIYAISELEKAKVKDDSFAYSLRREYMAMKDSSKAFEKLSNYFYQHNKTVNELAELFRKIIQMWSQGCNAVTEEQEQEVDELVTKMLRASSEWPIISPNFIGKNFHRVTVSSLNVAGKKMCEVNQLNQSIQEKKELRMLMDDTTTGDPAS
jgi:hypothetical protein